MRRVGGRRAVHEEVEGGESDREPYLAPVDVLPGGLGRDVPRCDGPNPFLWSSLVSVAGDGLLLAALPLLAAHLSCSAMWVALVTAAPQVSWLVLGLPAGVLVDRWPKRDVMLRADAARVLVLSALAALVVAGALTVPVLVVGAMLVGVGACFFDPAAQSLLPALTRDDPRALATANGRLVAIDILGRGLLGPPVGALAYAASWALPFVADAASFGASWLVLRRLPPARPVPAGSSERPSIRRGMADGLRVVCRDPALRRVVFGTGYYNFCWNLAMSTFVLYALRCAGMSPPGYGLVLGLGAIGGLVVSGTNGSWIAGLGARRVLAVSGGVQLAGWAVALLAPRAPALAVGVGFTEVASAVLSVSVVTHGQRRPPAEFRGRVASVIRFLATGSAALGSAAGGTAATVGGAGAPLRTSSALLGLGLLVLGVDAARGLAGLPEGRTVRPLGLGRVS
jgi:MFS family permease